MAASDRERIKFCRYCDGVIEWDTKVCPHCGETLELVDFEQMDFVAADQTPPKVKGLRERPTLPGRRRKPEPEEPPTKKIPVVPPANDGPPLDEPVFHEGGVPPVVKPISSEPPVVKPVSPGPPVVKPVGKGPPVVRPVGKSPPVMKPVGRQPPVVKPVGKQPPVVQPVGEGPPVVKPIGKLPPVVEPVTPGPAEEPAECPVCSVEMAGPEDVGGTCGSCRLAVCLACLMRANGVRATTSPSQNRQRWNQHWGSVRPNQIRCPACGQRGFRS